MTDDKTKTEVKKIAPYNASVKSLDAVSLVLNGLPVCGCHKQGVFEVHHPKNGYLDGSRTASLADAITFAKTRKS